MEPRRFSKIIEKCPAERVKELARPIVEQHQVAVIRKPAKTLVMVRMRETVAKAEFYLGELLAAEAMVELEGTKGFSLLMGDDLDKAFPGRGILRKLGGQAIRGLRTGLTRYLTASRCSRP